MVNSSRCALLRSAFIIAQAVFVFTVQAATLTVNNTGDSGVGCTLRDAITASNQGGVGSTGCINSGGPFNSGSSDIINIPINSTITISQAPLDINQSMNIFGIGATVQRSTLLDDRLMTLDTPANVEIVGLTLISGDVSGGTSGGVIKVEGAVLGIRDSVIKDGGASNGGGLSIDSAAVRLVNTAVTDNSANLNGGGIDVINNSTLTLDNSTISSNSASSGGGIHTDESSSLMISNSTITGNYAGQAGGGVWASNLTLNQSLVSANAAPSGGGIYATNNTIVRVTNTTISGNGDSSTTPGNGNTLFGGGIYSRGAKFSITNSTISNNMAEDRGAGLYAFSSTADGSPSFRLSNSIVANSSGASDCLVRTGGSITAGRNNLIEDGSCNTAAINGDPRLGPLLDNGGATFSHALLVGSRAVSNGSNAVCLASPVNSVDQRGEPRANPDNTICDLGAFESPEGRTDSSFFVIPTQNGKNVIIEL